MEESEKTLICLVHLLKPPIHNFFDDETVIFKTIGFKVEVICTNSRNLFRFGFILSKLKESMSRFLN
jgi:hypothetical protein